MGEFPFAFGVEDRKAFAAVAFDHGKDRHVARAVRDIEHPVDRDPAIRPGQGGVYIDFRVFVATLVDLKNEARLDCIVHYGSDLADLEIHFQGQFTLSGIIGGKRGLDKFAAEDPVHMAGNRAAPYHFSQACADDVVLQSYIVLAEFRAGIGNRFQGLEKVGQARVKFQFRPEFTQPVVCQALQTTVFYETYQMVEIDRVMRYPCAPFRIDRRQGIDFFPEYFFIYAVRAKYRGLHVAGDQGLVKIPDTGDDVLAVQAFFRHCGIHSTLVRWARFCNAVISYKLETSMYSIPEIGPFKDRLAELDAQMAEPDFFADQKRAAEVAREHQRLSALVEKFEAYHALERQIQENVAIAEDDAAESELREMAGDELESLRKQRDELGAEVLRAMLPPDPSDSRNTIIEIRGGAGGDEANIFAGDLFRMYSRFAELRGWRVEVMHSSVADAGGFKEIICSIRGEEVYNFLKYESGVHRVQRVPETETGGRIHTSTATVAVLPEAEEVDVEIDPNDLEISTMRASGAGGQHVNTTDSAVQLVHLPTGVTVYCADERSQHKNRLRAMTVLRSRLLKAKEEEEHAKYAAERKGQVGTGDRSERIRTYNYPQSRVTDHRIGLNLSLPPIMEGNLMPIIDALHNADYEARIENLLKREA